MSAHQKNAHSKSKELLTIKEAAQVAGVCPQTLRNWDRAKKLVALRHPINGYRLYARDALEKITAGLKQREGSQEE